MHLAPVFSSSMSRGEPNKNGSGSVFERKEQLCKILIILLGLEWQGFPKWL